MKIWAAAVYDQVHLFNNEHDFDLFMDVHYSMIWEGNMIDPAPDAWADKRAILTCENIRDDDFVIVHVQDLQVPRDPNEAFGCIYNYEDFIGNIEGYDPALHRAALEEWVRFQRSSIEEAMSDAVWVDFPFEVEMLTDPGAYWRWDNATDDYEAWAEEQRK